MSSEYDGFELDEPMPEERPPLRRVSRYEDDLRRDFRDPPPPPRKPGFGFWMAVLWSLLYFVATQIVAAVVFAIPIIFIAMMIDAGQNAPPNDPFAWMKSATGGVAMLCIAGASQFAGLPLSWLLLRLWCGKPWKRKIALNRLPSTTHAILVLIGLPSLMALGLLVELPIQKYVPNMQQLMKAVGIETEVVGSTEAIAELLKNAPWALAIFVVGVSPAICEEVFCRGFLAQGLAGRYQTWAVVLIVSFLFGCLHADPQQGIGVMFIGAAVHGAYLATRSLLVAMSMHFVNNTLGVIHMNSRLYPILDPLGDALENSPYLFAASTCLLFCAVCYALYQTRCKLVALEPGMPVWQPKGVSGVELPPPNSGTIVSHDPISPLSVALVMTGAIAFGLVLAFA